MTDRRPFVGANWKMNGNAALGADIKVSLPTVAADVVVFPPAPYIADVRQHDMVAGVQNVHWATHGAYTGEISVAMANDAGATWALCGHSERRTHFGETSLDCARKAQAILDANLGLVLCIGETLDERKAGRTNAVLSAQLEPCAEQLSQAEGTRIVIAYEPVWAIGTGVTATQDDVAAAHSHIRSELRRLGASDAVRIIYGGSVTDTNADGLASIDSVDGFLVGGASLQPAKFASIVAAAADRKFA